MVKAVMTCQVNICQKAAFQLTVPDGQVQLLATLSGVRIDVRHSSPFGIAPDLGNS